MLRKTFLWATALAATSGGALGQSADVDAAARLRGERFTLISPFPAGGPVDVLARILAEGLSKRYGQPAIVEAATGAAGNIGMDKVRRARPDGHTLLVIPAGNLTINPTLMRDFPFDIGKDFAPITMLAKAPNVLVASTRSGIASARDVVARAKAHPDTLSYASPGVGSGLHLAGELFKQQTGADMLHVPYKGSAPALNDVLGGMVPLMFTNLPAALPHLRNGRLVALGVTAAERTPVAPQIPTLAEQGIAGVDVTSWYGLLAPAGVPAPVLAQLARDARDILSQPGVRQRLAEQGMTPATATPAEFSREIHAESAVWADVIQARGIRAE